MNGTGRKIQPEKRRRSAEARQFSEDRMQLLDTVREMIDIELERYGVPGGATLIPRVLISRALIPRALRPRTLRPRTGDARRPIHRRAARSGSAS